MLKAEYIKSWKSGNVPESEVQLPRPGKIHCYWSVESQAEITKL